MRSFLAYVILLGSVAPASYADTIPVAYTYYSGLCSKEVMEIVNSEQHLNFNYITKDYGAVSLIGSSTPDVSVPEAVVLGNEGTGRYDYMQTEETSLIIGEESQDLNQLWLEGPTKKGPWMSAFYLGERKECMVAGDERAAKMFLAK